MDDQVTACRGRSVTFSPQKAKREANYVDMLFPIHLEGPDDRRYWRDMSINLSADLGVFVKWGPDLSVPCPISGLTVLHYDSSHWGQSGEVRQHHKQTPSCPLSGWSLLLVPISSLLAPVRRYTSQGRARRGGRKSCFPERARTVGPCSDY